MNYSNKKDSVKKLIMKIESYDRNHDLSIEFDRIVTEFKGDVKINRIDEYKAPKLIGDYSYSMINLDYSRLCGIDASEVIYYGANENENSYIELDNLIKNNIIDLKNYDKIILLHSVVIRPEYRKLDIINEIVETMYKSHNSKNTLFLGLVLPLQYNHIDFNYYYNQKFVEYREQFKDATTSITAREYYSLSNLLELNDLEINNYKLFALAKRIGFEMINDDSYLFKLNKTTIRNRIKDKIKKEIEDN